VIRAPIDEVFSFFRDPLNLEAITPSWLGFAFTRTPPPLQEGVRIDYRLRLAGVPFRWRTRIAVWEPPLRFVDVQELGPYALWEHTHLFEPIDAGVLMTDAVRYSLPLGPLGRVAHWLAVRAALARIFDYRFEAVRARFASGSL
jgi:ligand-binding SRPBCC domain-containing protein